ncbi:MAG: DUF1772 domain-containing protein [Bacteroidota bacterium]
MMTFTNATLVMAATATALMAGLFFAWSCSVTLGLAKLPDAQYIAAIQSMNRAILNPVFFTFFFGAPLLLPLSAYLNYNPASTRFWLLAGATVVYVIGVFGVTVAGNVPLNEAMDKFQLSTASAADMAMQRARFEIPWNNLNMVRTVCSTISVILVIIACLTVKGD